ncbi:MAG: hypothetical protein LBQ47_04645 [Endomicrobium sp.]|jgi:lipopolysaccharide biosynthesis glycosyltransferase/ADP-heptose:LPS heptosyltransferase|nr:hypothetical protein [Endomicrobium sp.]
MKNNEKDFVNFVLCGDENFIIPIGVSITSVLKNLSKSRKARFFIFVSNWQEKDIKTITLVRKIRECEINVIPMEEYISLFDGINWSEALLPHFAKVSIFFRLLIFKILPFNIEKCFYLDGDMIVEEDLSLIYDSFPNDKLAAVVIEEMNMCNNAADKNSGLPHCHKWPEFEKYRQCPKSAPYFNSGFFLANVKLSKELDIFDKALQVIRAHTSFPFPDQDVLNIVIGQEHNDKIIYLDPSYNYFCDGFHPFSQEPFFYSKEQIINAKNKPKIYHFSNYNKPWLTYEHVEFFDIWWKYARLSPFKHLKQPRNKVFKVFSKTKEPHKTVIKILGIEIFKKKTENGIKRYYLFGIRVFKKHPPTEDILKATKHVNITALQNYEKLKNLKILSEELSNNSAYFDELFNKLFNRLDKLNDVDKLLVQNQNNVDKFDKLFDRLDKLNDKVAYIEKIIPHLLFEPKIEDNAVIISLIESLGDIVACEPVIEHAHNLYPDRPVYWLTQTTYYELLRFHPMLKGIITISAIEQAQSLKRRLPKTVKFIDLHFRNRWYLLDSKVIYNDNNSATTLENYLHENLLQALSKTAGLNVENKAPKFYLSPFAVLPKNLPQHYIAMHIKSSEISKDWDIEKWKVLINKFAQDGINIVEVGVSASFDGLKNYTPATNLPLIQDSAAVLSKADLFIGIDSSFAHIANALNIAGIILLGKYKNFEKYMPYSGNYQNGVNSKIIYAPKGLPAKDITVEEVYNAAMDLLKKN